MDSVRVDESWYLADVVLEHVIEDEPRNVVHVNTHLVAAASPAEAYEKSIALGQDAEYEYLNTDGKTVRVVFRGLAELADIRGELEDGTELSYTESVDVPDSELRSWVPAKDELSVFGQSGAKVDVPNYMPESIMRVLEDEGFDRRELLGGAQQGHRERLGSRGVATEALIASLVEDELPTLPPALREWARAHLTTPRLVTFLVLPEGPETVDLWLVTDYIGKQDSSSRVVYDSATGCFGIADRLGGGIDWFMGASGTFAQAVDGM